MAAASAGIAVESPSAEERGRFGIDGSLVAAESLFAEAGIASAEIAVAEVVVE
jgi:hypothetical protein